MYRDKGDSYFEERQHIIQLYFFCSDFLAVKLCTGPHHFQVRRFFIPLEHTFDVCICPPLLMRMGIRRYFLCAQLFFFSLSIFFYLPEPFRHSSMIDERYHHVPIDKKEKPR